MSLQGVTAASVHKNMHSMCNGANLAYSRNAFEAVDGFKGIDSIASGDDMLLMHKIALQYPGAVHYLKSNNVIVQTEPVHSIKEFFNQRIRWASKADKYDDKRIFWVLLIVYLLNVLLLLLPIISVVGRHMVGRLLLPYAHRNQNHFRAHLFIPHSKILRQAEPALGISPCAAFSYPVHCYCRLAGQVRFLSMEGKESKIITV